MAKKKIPSDSIVRAGFVILFAYSIFNLTNFLFHFFSARMLGPEEYGIVAALFSIIYLIGICSTTIQNTATKFTAEFKIKKDYSKINYFLKKGLKKLFFYSMIALIIYLICSPLIASFLKIPLMPVIILSPLIILSILSPLNKGILQGMQKFNALGFNMTLEGILKLVLALLLIYAGFKSNGAIFAVVIASAIGFAFTFPFLKFGKIKPKKIDMDSKKIYKFSLISFMALFLFTALYNIDILLVKHFFSAENAGHYAALSLLGKIIFFGSTAIGLVMFPKIAEMKNKKEGGKIFKKSLLFVFLISIIVWAVYALVPGQIVNLVFGKEYADISALLGIFGIAMLFLSLSYICILNKLAQEKKKFIFILLIILITEIIAIILFHHSLKQIINLLIILNIILFLLLIRK